MTTYVLKYYFINDDKTITKKLTRFTGVDNLLGFSLNISFFCSKDHTMCVYDKATKEKLIEGTISEILHFFKPNMADDELKQYIHINLREKTLQHIEQNGL